MGESSCDFGVIECRLPATHTVQCVLNAEENRGSHKLSLTVVAHLVIPDSVQKCD